MSTAQLAALILTAGPLALAAIFAIADRLGLVEVVQ